MRLKQPKTFLIGQSVVDEDALFDYLDYTDNFEFRDTYYQAIDKGLSSAEALCSFYAKLCYKSLTLGHNSNILKIRDIENNIKGCFDMGHGSVFEHVWFNFITTDCSRVFTHELVRHRVGTAFSQTSGRYCRIDNLEIVWDPILNGCEEIFIEALEYIEESVYLAECRLGLRKPCNASGTKWEPDDDFDFDKRKKITSAIRRIAPTGQVNEMGWSMNLRCARQLMMIRTSRHAEYEIRVIFNQVYDLLKDKFPTMFHGAKEEKVDGLLEISGMKCQPWEK